MSTEIDGSPRRLEAHIETLRHELGELVSELDRRRHEAFDVRLQLQKHPTAVAVAGVALAAIVGIGIAVAVHRSHERARPVNRARAARAAMQRLVRDPEHMAREPGFGEKILAAAGTAAASILVKRALDRLVPARP